SRGRHTSFSRDWRSDVCSSDLSGTAGSSPRGESPDAGRGWAPGSCCSYEPTLTLLEGGLIGPVVVTGGRGRRGAAARAAGPIVTPLGLVHRGGGPAQGRPDLVDCDLVNRALLALGGLPAALLETADDDDAGA